MANDLLGDYGLTKLTNLDYRLDFQIPDNCDYEAVDGKDLNLMIIRLQSGQSEPSPVFVACNHLYTMRSTVLTIEFNQEYNGKTRKKPIIRVEV